MQHPQENSASEPQRRRWRASAVEHHGKTSLLTCSVFAIWFTQAVHKIVVVDTRSQPSLTDLPHSIPSSTSSPGSYSNDDGVFSILSAAAADLKRFGHFTPSTESDHSVLGKKRLSEWVSRVLRSAQHMSFWRHVFPSNHLHWYWQLKTNRRKYTKKNKINKLALGK